MAAEESPNIILYTNYDSSPTWRVRITLALKGINFERRCYCFDNPDPEYHNVNPLVQVPSLVVDGEILTQSMAIVEYLDEKYPQPKLLPADLMKRARARQIAELVNSGIQPSCNYLYTLYKDNEEERDKQSKICVEKGFSAIEKILRKTAGTFCVGNEITIADVCLGPQVYRAAGYGVDVTRFPMINERWKNLSSLPAFIATHPDNEPDSPKKE